jgi:hypothetical protein
MIIAPQISIGSGGNRKSGTNRPKSLTLSQSVATRVRLRRKKRVLRYALRQNRYVAMPPLANCKNEEFNQKKLIKKDLCKEQSTLTLPLNKGRAAIAFSKPMYLYRRAKRTIRYGKIPFPKEKNETYTNDPRCE